MESTTAEKKHWFVKLLDRLFERYDIGRSDDVYLTRWVLFGSRYGPGHKVFLHQFHRSDTDAALHDHPWRFWSLILRGGYYEWTPTSDTGTNTNNLKDAQEGIPYQRKWYGILSLLRRPAEWLHRVELFRNKDGALKTCWTLIWTSEKSRSWGFACKNGWIPWKEFSANEESGKSGCGD